MPDLFNGYTKARLELLWTITGLKRDKQGVALCLICEKQPATVVQGSTLFCSEGCKMEDMRRNFPPDEDEYCCSRCGR